MRRSWRAEAIRARVTSFHWPIAESSCRYAGYARLDNRGMSSHPYEQLTPDVVLDALASVGLYGDGRLLALSSYENRVYQVHLEEPMRARKPWSPSSIAPAVGATAQILEEHAFAAELMAAEVPAVGPLVLRGKTLHEFGGFEFSVSPRRGGRAPELDDAEVLEWIGRFLARIHMSGKRRPFASRPALDVRHSAWSRATGCWSIR